MSQTPHQPSPIILLNKRHSVDSNRWAPAHLARPPRARPPRLAGHRAYTEVLLQQPGSAAPVAHRMVLRPGAAEGVVPWGRAALLELEAHSSGTGQAVCCRGPAARWECVYSRRPVRSPGIALRRWDSVVQWVSRRPRWLAPERRTCSGVAAVREAVVSRARGSELRVVESRAYRSEAVAMC